MQLTHIASHHEYYLRLCSRLESPIPSCCAGSLRELTLTGLPQLRHLKVTQQPPRSEPQVTVQCRALRLPHSLLSFHLTVSTESLQLGEQLSALLGLPKLETVGLHGPLFGKIPPLPPTLTRCRTLASLY